MLGRELRYLAGVADLATLDFEAASLTINSGGESVAAIYVGTYTGGYRIVEDTEAPVHTVAVKTKQFKDMSTLFGDDIKVSMTPGMGQGDTGGVRFRSKLSSMGMAMMMGQERTLGDVTPPEQSEVKWSVTLPGNKLIEEMDIAASFASTQPNSPVLTGVRIAVTKRLMRLDAFDGYELVYRATIKTKPKGDEGEVVVPHKDFLLGLKLCASGSNMVTVAMRSDGHVYITNPDSTAMFKCGFIHGNWPRMDAYTDIPVGTDLILSPDLLRYVSQAGRALAALDVSLTPHDNSNRTVFKVQEDEGGYGSFTTRIRGRIDTPITYSLRAMASLARLGQEVILTVPPTSTVPTLAEAGHRQCWIAARL